MLLACIKSLCLVSSLPTSIAIASESMDNIINQIKEFASSADETSREEFSAALRRVLYSLEDDDDIVHRVGYLVRNHAFTSIFVLISRNVIALAIIYSSYRHQPEAI